MKIPRRMRFLNRDIVVNILKANDPELMVDDKKCNGNTDTDHRIINLTKVGEPGNEGIQPMNQELQDECFIHEYIHLVLEAFGYDELSGSEEFVTSMAAAIHHLVKQVSES